MAGPIEIIPGIYQVGGGSWGNVTEVVSTEGSGNVYLVGDGDTFALIDAGTPRSVEAMLSNCASLGVPPGRISRIAITHAHGDHVFGIADVLQRTEAQVVASPLTTAALHGDSAVMERLFLTHQIDFRQVEVAFTIAEGDEIELGGITFTGLLTPGHIPDSLCLAGDVNGTRVLFSGDTAIGDQGPTQGVVGWLDGHWGANPRHLLASLARMQACEADLMLAGHGQPSRGREAVTRSLQHCIARVEQLLAIEGLHTMMPLDMED